MRYQCDGDSTLITTILLFPLILLLHRRHRRLQAEDLEAQKKFRCLSS